MHLYFIRHGEASHQATSDHERPLTAHGIRQAQLNSELFTRLNIPIDTIYCSPRRRAQETAQHIGAARALTPQVHPACDFEFNAQKALTIAQAHAPTAHLVLIGHNPSISATVSELCGAYLHFVPCALAAIDITGLRHNSRAQLLFYTTPNLLETHS